jgi:hypothetical protein
MKFAIGFWPFLCALSLAAPAPNHTQRAWLQSAGLQTVDLSWTGGDF